jgi:hypothetical protein
MRLCGLVATPALLVAGFFFVDMLGSFAGRPLIWPATTLTLADAVILRNAGEAAAQILHGADPNAPSPVRRASAAFGRRSVLPVEAAVMTGETHLLELLADYGARLDEDTLVRLRCQAERIGEDRVAGWIDARLARRVACDQ